MASMNRRRRLACAIVAVVLATPLSGCGDSDDATDQSATEAWADDVCSAFTDWTSAIDDARAMLGDTGNLNAETIRNALNTAADATDTLVGELGDVGTPDTEAGDQAEDELMTLSEQLQEQGQVVEDATSQTTGGLDELLTQVSAVTGALSTMLSDVGTTVTSIRDLEGADELRDAFESAPSCQTLQESVGAGGN